MEKTFEIDNQKINLKVSAGTVRTYRDAYGRDLIVDIGVIEKDIFDNKSMSAESSELAENIIYLMAKECNRDIEPLSEWLEKFSPFFVFKAVVFVIDMWHENMRTLNDSKKK